MGLAAIVASAAAVNSIGAQGDPVTIDVSQCVNLPTPEQRLACFEAQVETARTAPPAAAAPAAAAPAAAAPAATAPAATAPATASNPRDRGVEEERPDPPDIHAKVAELRETVPNAFLITLDNGQVWRQTVPQHYPLRVGSDVRIYFSRWRAYRLTNEQLRGYIQVERVR